MLNKGLHSEKVGSWKPEAGRLLSDRQNRHSSRHPELVSGSEKLNSAASDPLCVSPQGGKLLPSFAGEMERGQLQNEYRYSNPQNQNAYGKCLTNEKIGRGRNQFNVTGRVPETMLYDPLCISPQCGEIPQHRCRNGSGIYSCPYWRRDVTK